MLIIQLSNLLIICNLHIKKLALSNTWFHNSHESKPPLPPTHKSDDKPSTTSRSVERSSSSNVTKSKLSPKSSRSEPHMSPRVSATSINAKTVDISRNKSKDAKDGIEEEQSLIDKIKYMGQRWSFLFLFRIISFCELRLLFRFIVLCELYHCHPQLHFLCWLMILPQLQTWGHI